MNTVLCIIGLLIALVIAFKFDRERYLIQLNTKKKGR